MNELTIENKEIIESTELRKARIEEKLEEIDSRLDKMIYDRHMYLLTSDTKRREVKNERVC